MAGTSGDAVAYAHGMSGVPELVASLDRRLEELATEIHALETARAALCVMPSATKTDGKPRAGKPHRRASAKRVARKRAAVPLRAPELTRMLADAGSGLSASQIAQRTDAGYHRVLALLRELEASGQVRRAGTRRSTLWRTITDEERIAERAAELEALARGSRSR